MTALATPESTEAEVREADRLSLTVTVHHRSGRRYVGAPRPHPTHPDYFVLRSGGRQAPEVIHYDDVLEMSVEC